MAQGLLEVGGAGGRSVSGPFSRGRRAVAEPAALPEVAHRLEGEVGMHGRGAVADEAGEVMDAPALGGLGDERGAAAQASPDQVVVHGADGEQHGHVSSTRGLSDDMRSLRTTTSAPSRTAAAASRQTRSTASRRPHGPLATS